MGLLHPPPPPSLPRESRNRRVVTPRPLSCYLPIYPPSLTPRFLPSAPFRPPFFQVADECHNSLPASR